MSLGAHVLGAESLPNQTNSVMSKAQGNPTSAIELGIKSYHIIYQFIYILKYLS